MSSPRVLQAVQMMLDTTVLFRVLGTKNFPIRHLLDMSSLSPLPSSKDKPSAPARLLFDSSGLIGFDPSVHRSALDALIEVSVSITDQAAIDTSIIVIPPAVSVL
ncbi:hypothetical protein LOK49_LG14G00140 [Camellia lanceoleosa]|uniref:Uncharacterized protein n=1 Tax=Camellia lanceoleosa TaxID=1840588 RepID=A0ACC0FDY4_9ERIC|nr:hypothetical protein LOK49_LG14G00140 [Camellia lanceoleosa]